MKLKTDSEIETAIHKQRTASGFSNPGGSPPESGSHTPVSDVRECCAPVAGMYDSVEAIPISVIISLAMQLLPIIFGEGGFSLEKLQAILELISSIFE